MIAIQRTSASPLGATCAPRSSNVTSRKNHRAGAAASIIITTTTRRNGMRSHVTSMGRRTKNSFRLPAIAMPSPEVNEQMQTMTYNETGKWRENFDLASWAKEIREVRFSRPFNSNDILFPGGDKDVDCVRFESFVLRFVLDRGIVSSLLRGRRERGFVRFFYVLPSGAMRSRARRLCQNLSRGWMTFRRKCLPFYPFSHSQAAL